MAAQARSRLTLLLLLLAGLLYAAHGAAAAQPPVKPPHTYLPTLVAAEQAVAGLPPGAQARERTPEAMAAVQKLAPQLARLATERAAVGDTEGAGAAFDLRRQPLPAVSAQDLARLQDAQAEDAIQAIVAQARAKQVVLLNEAHHMPVDRAFAMRLAAALRKIGYSYLACETFFEAGEGASVRAPRQVVFDTGWYTREPTFAGFVNAALADGWKLVPYEHIVPIVPGGDMLKAINEREEGEAANLVQRIFAKDPKARVFVYAGYAHVDKSPPGSADPITWMGERLRRATGLAGMEGRVDLQVIHPRYASHDGRPDWLRTLAGRSPRPVPASLLPKQGRRLIKAVRVDAVTDAVPADVVLVEAGKPAPVLMLPAGEFRYDAED